VPSSYAPAVCFADILDNIERIRTYIGAMDRATFERDGRTRDAVERCLERICEAAIRLGDQAAQLVPGQPWNDIRGMGQPPTACLRSSQPAGDLECHPERTPRAGGRRAAGASPIDPLTAPSAHPTTNPRHRLTDQRTPPQPVDTPPSHDWR
jgi:hypothetical protein